MAIPKKRCRGEFPISVKGLPNSLSKVNLNVTGLDVGATQHYVAVPDNRDEDAVRCFGTFTAELEALANWLQEYGVETVAMESTGL